MLPVVLPSPQVKGITGLSLLGVLVTWPTVGPPRPDDRSHGEVQLPKPQEVKSPAFRVLPAI